MYEATLSIDLGASYTKVAYRHACIPAHIGEIKKDAEVLLIDDSALIPSLAIRTRNPAQPWVFGREAAKMNPDEGMQVFQNWKADLFRPRNDKDSATAAIIAHRFFEWLRSRLESGGVDVRKCQTRVAMPAFDTFDENAVLLARCMDLSGWDNPTLILKVREPHANILGLLAGGRNIVTQDSSGQFQASYGKMFGLESFYIQAARGYTLFGTHSNLVKIMVVDIGAFTTDLAMLTFDVTSSTDGLSAVRQESHALGVINQLDRPMFAALGARHGFSWSALQFDESELCKKDLYQGKSHSILTRTHGRDVQLDLGDDADIKAVEETARSLAAAAWEKVTAFVAGETPAHVFLTGGGSLIRPLAEALIASFKAHRMPVGVVKQGNGEPGTGWRRSWQQTGEGLQRLATAVGGGSVILQETAMRQSDLQRPSLRPPIVTGPPPDYATCRCQGANKDCCFCGGRGFIRI